jgi:4,5-DOPA dioxygenase extradiol
MNPTTIKMPALFIGHGSPMNMIEDNAFTRSLVRLGRELPRPQAILVVSAHWLTEGVFVTCAAQPEMIYDFYGFPEELYRVRYPAPGAPEVAQRLTQNAHQPPIRCGEWGLDHAAYSVLKWLYPQADIPVIELSLDIARPPQYHYDLGLRLAPLREQGVLIIGSGNLVHNLRVVNPDPDARPYEWAVQFDEAAKADLLARRHEKLINYAHYGRIAALAIPTNEHYLPMLYALALQTEGEPLTFTHEGLQNGSISMRCFRIG